MRWTNTCTLVCGIAIASSGCAKAADDGLGFGSAYAPMPGAGDGSDGSDSDGSETGDGAETDPAPTDGSDSGPTTDPSAGTTTGETGSTSDATINPLDESSTGSPPTDEQPDSGMYSHCLSAQACGPGFGCLTTEAMDDGMCTVECVAAGTPTNCDPVPGGNSTLACITVTGLHLCVMDCSGGATCPSGMVCVTESDDNGPIEICV